LVRAGLLTVSDRAAAGTYPDDSGPEMARLLQSFSEDARLEAVEASQLEKEGDSAKKAKPDPWRLFDVQIAKRACVGDEPNLIRRTIIEWTDTESVDIILTSGGTGFGPRDTTPEAIKSILHREAPGVAQALLQEGLKHTPLAVLSRPVCGTRGSAFIATLPGSVKAVRENIMALKPLLPRIMELMTSNKCDHGAGVGVGAQIASTTNRTASHGGGTCECCK
jgi:gephyrin